MWNLKSASACQNSIMQHKVPLVLVAEGLQDRRMPLPFYYSIAISFLPWVVQVVCWWAFDYPGFLFRCLRLFLLTVIALIKRVQLISAFVAPCFACLNRTFWRDSWADLVCFTVLAWMLLGLNSCAKRLVSKHQSGLRGGKLTRGCKHLL